MPIIHASVGTELTQAEFESSTLHVMTLMGVQPGIITGATLDRRYPAGAQNILALATAGVGVEANYLRVFPFIPPRAITVDRLCCWVSTLLAGNNIKLGIFDDNAGYPGVLRVDSGPIDTSTATIKDITVSVSMIGGQIYWMGYVLNTITTLALRKLALGAYLSHLGLSIANPPVWGMGWRVAHTFANALPNPYTAGGAIIAAANDVIVAVRAT